MKYTIDGEELTLVGRDNLNTPPERIKLYDFRRPDKFSKEQIQTISIMQSMFCDLLEVQLLKVMKSSVKVNVEVIDQMTYREATQEIESECSHLIYTMNPLLGSAIVQLDQKLNALLLDRLCGGNSSPAHIGRELAEAEQLIIRHIAEDMEQTINQSWAPILPMHCKLNSIETKTKFAQVVPPTEMIILVQIKVETGDSSNIRIIYPYLTIEPIIGKLNAKYWYSNVLIKKGSSNNQLSDKLKFQAEIRAQTEDLTVQELQNLKAGDEIPISMDQISSPRLFIGNSPVLQTIWENPSESSALRLKPVPEAAAVEVLPSAESQEKSLELLLSEKITAIGTMFTKEIRRLESRLNNSQDAHDFSPNQANFTDLQSFTTEQSDYIFGVLTDLYPQIQALVLTQFSNPLAADILSKLEIEQRIEVLRRISEMGSCPPWILKTLTQYLNDRLLFTEGLDLGGGIQKAVDILNYVPATIEREVIELWEKTQPELCDQIKNLMFVFEDLVLVSRDSLALLYDQCPAQDFARACKKTIPEVMQHLQQSIGAQNYSELQKAIESTGPISLKEVDAAKMRIIQVLKELDSAGEVIIHHAGTSLVD